MISCMETLESRFRMELTGGRGGVIEINDAIMIDNTIDDNNFEFDHIVVNTEWTEMMEETE